MKYALSVVLTLLALTTQIVAQNTEPRKTLCKTPANQSTCYWTRGRLALYNGAPPWRMWKVGTNRIVAIYSGAAAWTERKERDGASPEFPANLKKTYDSQIKDPSLERVFADFEICPLEPERSDEMQAMCIESAKNIVVQR